MSKTRRYLIFTFTSLVLLGVGLFIYSHHREQPHLTLRDALWVTDKDMKVFHPPHSRESKYIVDYLEDNSYIHSLEHKTYSGPILYRQGLTTSDKPTEPLFIYGFTPPN